MATLVKNVGLSAVPLPAVYGGGILRPGAGAVVADAEANVLAALGTSWHFQTSTVPDGQVGAISAVAAARLMSLGTPAAKGTTDVRAAVAANAVGDAFAANSLAGGADAIVAVKAFLDLGTKAAGHLNTVVEAKTAGTAGNSITVAATGDSLMGGGVTIAELVNAVTIHYESGVSTVADVEAAITATSTKIEVKTAGTGATVLTSPGDDFTAASLAGGVNSAAAVKASLDLGTLTDHLNTVVEAKIAGAAGNSLKVSSAAGAAAAATDSGLVTALTFVAGVTTVTQIETAIGGSSNIEVKTPGTGANILTASATGLSLPPPFTNPDVPRNLRVTLGSGWDGGNITVYGTDQFGNQQSEVFTAGSGVTRVGTMVFKTVSGATKGQAGSSSATVSIGTGDKLGASGHLVDANGILLVDGAIGAGTIDQVTSAVTPSTVPNGSHAYLLLANAA